MEQIVIFSCTTHIKVNKTNLCVQLKSVKSHSAYYKPMTDRDALADLTLYNNL